MAAPTTRPPTRRCALRPAAGGVHAARRVRRRGRGRADRRERRPAGARPRPAARHALGWSASARRAGPDPVLRRRDAAAGRADQPPRRRLDRLAAGVPPGPQGRAGGDQPRRRPARGVRQQGVPPRRQPGGDRRLQRRLEGVPRSSARPTSGAASASAPTPRSRPRRSRRQADKMRAKATKAKAAQNMDRRAERLLAGLGGDAARRPGRQAARSPTRRPAGRRRCGRPGCRSRTARSRSSPTSTSPSTGAPASSCSASTVPARPRCCACSRASSRPTPVRSSRATGCELGYYAQEHETLDTERTVLENMRSAAPDLADTAVRRVLGSFLFCGDDVDKPAGVLSGGEKTRLALATLVVSGANVLLLDEPTNNLDPASRGRGARRAAHVRRRRRARHPRRGCRRGAGAGARPAAARRRRGPVEPRLRRPRGSGLRRGVASPGRWAIMAVERGHDRLHSLW